MLTDKVCICSLSFKLI